MYRKQEFNFIDFNYLDITSKIMLLETKRNLKFILYINDILLHT